MHDPIIIATPTGKIVLTNNLTEQLFNRTKTELVNLFVEDLMPERFRTKHILHRETYVTTPFVRPMCTGAVTHDLRGIKKDLEEFPIDISLSPLQINGKNFILVGMRDLTERYAHEQSLKTNSEFIDNLCHELRNTVNGTHNIMPMLIQSFELIRLATTKHQQSLEETGPILEEAGHNLEIIKLCTEQQKNLLNKVLDLSKLENDKLELNPSPFELTKNIKNTVQIFTTPINEKKLTLTLDLPEDPIWVKTDLHQLSEVIINLISNAIKFTDHGGITFTTTIESPLNLFAEETEELIINFIVQDTGIGMLPQEITNLFQRFSQANSHTREKYGGSGLGLSISKKIIELMGGTILVESEVGLGTKFSFFIKCSRLNAQEILKATQSTKLLNYDTTQTATLERKKILIVEDNQINTTILLKQLAPTNCKCYTASNGAKALEEYEKHRFNLIFMDLEIPILNGFEVTKQIREKELLSGYSTPIIGVSGYSRQSIKDRALQCGMNAYLTKPYTPKELFELIDQHILIMDNSSSIEQAPSEVILCTPRFTNLTTLQSSSSTLDNSSTGTIHQTVEISPTNKTPRKKFSLCPSTKKRSLNFIVTTPNNHTNPFELWQSPKLNHQQINHNKCTIL